jgi:hypothetical protein
MTNETSENPRTTPRSMSSDHIRVNTADDQELTDSYEIQGTPTAPCRGEGMNVKI